MDFLVQPQKHHEVCFRLHLAEAEMEPQYLPSCGSDSLAPEPCGLLLGASHPSMVPCPGNPGALDHRDLDSSCLLSSLNGDHTVYTDLAGLMYLLQVWKSGGEEALASRPGFMSQDCADIP